MEQKKQEAPNPKHQITSKLQVPKFEIRNRIGLGYLELVIGIYLGFGI
jgi:hypothetical protein